MSWELVGSAVVSGAWIKLGDVTANLIKLELTTAENPYNLNRFGYLRQEFESGHYSAIWTRIYPKVGESHLLVLPDLGYASRGLYLTGRYPPHDWALTVYQDPSYSLPASGGGTGPVSINGGVYVGSNPT